METKFALDQDVQIKKTDRVITIIEIKINHFGYFYLCEDEQGVIDWYNQNDLEIV